MLAAARTATGGGQLESIFSLVYPVGFFDDQVTFGQIKFILLLRSDSRWTAIGFLRIGELINTKNSSTPILTFASSLKKEREGVICKKAYQLPPSKFKPSFDHKLDI
jgi:hypothetical protein